MQVDELEEKFFVIAILKALRTGTSSEALFIQIPASMDEIPTRVERHIDAEQATTSKRERENKDDLQHF